VPCVPFRPVRNRPGFPKAVVCLVVDEEVAAGRLEADSKQVRLSRLFPKDLAEALSLL
jgi:hypothetical protein